jgi:transposase
MKNSRKHWAFTKQFKHNSVEYRRTHPELTTLACAKNLGVGRSTLEK